MSIIRSARKERDFAILSNALLQDSRLSMRGLGLLVRLLSRPDNWETNSEVLAREFNCGREQMRSVLNELSDAGYMRLSKTQDERGHWSSRWYVFDEPETEQPETRSPGPGNRVLGDPDAITKNRDKEPIQRTDIGNKEQTPKAAKQKVGKPSDVDEQIWEDWLQLRKTKKAPVTQTAIDGISREAMKAGYTLEQALEACCSNGWQGFKAEWVNKPLTQQRASNQMQMKSFAQQERERGWLRWEEMTGREHEEMRKVRQAEGLVYMPPDQQQDQGLFLLGDES